MHPTHPQEKSVFKCYHVQIIWIFKSLELSFDNNKTGKALWIGLQETEGAKFRLEKAPRNIFLFSITINPILQKNHTMLYTEKFRNSWVNQDIVQFPITLTRRLEYLPQTDILESSLLRHFSFLDYVLPFYLCSVQKPFFNLIMYNTEKLIIFLLNVMIILCLYK